MMRLHREMHTMQRSKPGEMNREYVYLVLRAEVKRCPSFAAAFF